jgi:hypothetical protein
MKHSLSITFIFVTVLHLSTPFGASITQIMNLRCTFADSYLKDAFEIYDRYVISSKTVSFYFYAKDVEPEKISRVNDTYFIDGFDKTKPTRYGIWK